MEKKSEATPAQKRWIRNIHTAARKLGLADDSYRALLYGAAGVESTREISTWAQYDAVMQAFRSLGFRLSARRAQVDAQEKRQAHMITARQEYYIKGLWALASRAKTDESLRALVQRITGSGDITWLTKRDAAKLIQALRDITLKAGFDPDHAPGKQEPEPLPPCC